MDGFPSAAFAIHLLGDGTVAAGWPAAGLAVGSGPANYYYGPHLIPSLAGDVLVVWQQPAILPITSLLALGTVMIQRLTPAGTIAAGWPAGGVTAHSGVDSITTPLAVSDGSGGAILSWVEHGATTRVAAVRVTSAGVVSPGWATAGLGVSDPGARIDPGFAPELDATSEERFTMSSDGMGGALLAWTDDRPPGPRVSVRRVAGDGTFPVGWSAPVAASDSGAVHAITNDGAGGAVVAFAGDIAAGSSTLRLSRIAPDGVVATLASLASASIDRKTARLEWLVSDAAGVRFDVERRVDDEAWSVIATRTPDGRGMVAFTDAVPAGAHTLGYRLAWTRDGTRVTAGDVSLVVPDHARFALESVSPNPARDAISVRLALRANEPATLELIDVAGRRVAIRALDAGGGERVLRLDETRTLPAGVYLVRVSQGRDRALARVAIVR